MRYRRWIGLGAATVALGLIASTPALGVGTATTTTPAVQKGPWHGTSDQSLPVDFDVVRVNGSKAVEPQDVAVLATCEITGDQLEFHFGGGDIPLHKDGSFKVRYFDPLGGDLRWSGKLGDTTGSGTISLIYAGLTNDDGLQLCPSGTVSWQAQAGGPASRPSNSLHPAYRIHLSIDRSGHATWSETKG